MTLGHEEAWHAGVLHCDISYNNILIYDGTDDQGNHVRTGKLVDWDLAKYVEDMNQPARNPYITVGFVVDYLRRVR